MSDNSEPIKESTSPKIDAQEVDERIDSRNLSLHLPQVLQPQITGQSPQRPSGSVEAVPRPTGEVLESSPRNIENLHLHQAETDVSSHPAQQLDMPLLDQEHGEIRATSSQDLIGQPLFQSVLTSTTATKVTDSMAESLPGGASTFEVANIEIDSLSPQCGTSGSKSTDLGSADSSSATGSESRSKSTASSSSNVEGNTQSTQAENSVISVDNNPPSSSVSLDDQLLNPCTDRAYYSGSVISTSPSTDLGLPFSEQSDIDELSPHALGDAVSDLNLNLANPGPSRIQSSTSEEGATESLSPDPVVDTSEIRGADVQLEGPIPSSSQVNPPSVETENDSPQELEEACALVSGKDKKVAEDDLLGAVGGPSDQGGTAQGASGYSPLIAPDPDLILGAPPNPAAAAQGAARDSPLYTPDYALVVAGPGLDYDAGRAAQGASGYSPLIAPDPDLVLVDAPPIPAAAAQGAARESPLYTPDYALVVAGPGPNYDAGRAAQGGTPIYTPDSALVVVGPGPYQDAGGAARRTSRDAPLRTPDFVLMLAGRGPYYDEARDASRDESLYTPDYARVVVGPGPYYDAGRAAQEAARDESLYTPDYARVVVGPGPYYDADQNEAAAQVYGEINPFAALLSSNETALSEVVPQASRDITPPSEISLAEPAVSSQVTCETSDFDLDLLPPEESPPNSELDQAVLCETTFSENLDTAAPGTSKDSQETTADSNSGPSTSGAEAASTAPRNLSDTSILSASGPSTSMTPSSETSDQTSFANRPPRRHPLALTETKIPSPRASNSRLCSPRTYRNQNRRMGTSSSMTPYDLPTMYSLLERQSSFTNYSKDLSRNVPTSHPLLSTWKCRQGSSSNQFQTPANYLPDSPAPTRPTSTVRPSTNRTSSTTTTSRPGSSINAASTASAVRPSTSWAFSTTSTSRPGSSINAATTASAVRPSTSWAFSTATTSRPGSSASAAPIVYNMRTSFNRAYSIIPTSRPGSSASAAPTASTVRMSTNRVSSTTTTSRPGSSAGVTSTASSAISASKPITSKTGKMTPKSKDNEKDKKDPKQRKN